jgi:signal transduction histidine kinase
MRELNLFHKFLLVLFLSTLLGIVTLASTISYFVRKNVVEGEVRNTASLVRELSRAGLSHETFGYAVQEQDRSTFTRFASQLLSMPEIIRVKIFDRAGALVWSDEERLIGKNFVNNRELKEALGGKIQVVMGVIKSEHIYERERYNERRLLEVYVPLLTLGSDEVYGVLEIYKHPVSYFSLMDQMRRAVWVISLAVGILLFASCAWFFWDAVRRQDKADREKRLVEAQLIQAEKLATIGEMLAGLAHEINNPLSIVMSKVQLVLKDLQAANPRTELVQDLRVIDRNIARIGGIIRSLLVFSRKSNSDLVPLNLNTVIGEDLTLVGKLFAQRNIFFEQGLEPSLPQILGDPNQLQQVFLNLLSNARDAMPQGGRIWVRTFSANHDGRWVVAEVHDSGQGIPPEIIERIFDPFFTTKGPREGAGLGLAVSYGIVKSHGGEIQVESRPGEGATFTLKFPVRV